jgi:hypothetical protein
MKAWIIKRECNPMKKNQPIARLENIGRNANIAINRTKKAAR